MLGHLNITVVSVFLCLSFSQVYAAICPGFFNQPLLTSTHSSTLEGTGKSDLSVGSVINIKTQHDVSRIFKRQIINDRDPVVLEQLFYRLVFAFEHGNNIVLGNGVKKDTSLVGIKDEIFSKIFEMYETSQYYRWFSIDDSDEYNYISEKIVPTKSYSPNNRWMDFMKIFTQVLNSKSVKQLGQLYEEDEASGRSFSFTDWSTITDEYDIDSEDDKINKLIDILYYIDLPKDTRKYKSYHVIAKEKKLRSDRVTVLKNIIMMFSLSLFSGVNTYDFGSDVDNIFKPYWVNQDKCSATIVASNILITSAQCLRNLAPGDRIEARIEDKLYHSVAYYINPSYLKQIANGKSASNVDVALVRFPEGTFLGITPSKLGFSDFTDKGSLIISDRITDKNSTFYQVILEANTSDPMVVSNKGVKDFGSPIFNDKNEFVGLTAGTMSGYVMEPRTKDYSKLSYPLSTTKQEPGSSYKVKLQASSFADSSVQYFFKLISLIDPKVKVRGLNLK